MLIDMIWDDNDDIKTIRCTNRRSIIRHLLAENREERRPYVFLTDTMQCKPLKTVLVPISRLEEEVYKAEICTYIARKEKCHCILLYANDYGTMARRNLQKITTRFRLISEQSGINLSFEISQANKNSDGVIREAVERQRELQSDLIILTASREYGLDDLLFGPPELYAIRHSLIPVMLVNPRDDLFSLCD